MINYLILIFLGWSLHIGKIFFPERKQITFIDFIEAHAFEFTGAFIFSLAIFYAQYLDGQASNVGAFMTGYMLNSIWQGIKNNHFGKLGDQ